MDITTQLANANLDPALMASILVALEQGQKDTIKVAQQAALIHAKDVKIAALTLELAHHKRMRFANKSEAFTSVQRDLFAETINLDLSAMQAELEQVSTPSVSSKKTPRTARQPLPAHLPRIEHHHDVADCTCADCGRALVKIGEDITEQLDVEPARFFVHRHIRPQYACRACETVTAEAIPASIIDGSVAAPGLHAWVVTQKFLDHLPLYRIEQISGRYGVPIARSTLADWVGRIGVALQPLADRLAETLRQRRVLHADETPVQQLDPGAGNTKRAYLWAYRSHDLEHGPPMIVFDYQTSRSGQHAQAFLQDWRGALMVDDYSGYKALFKTGIVELACFAHTRRKFFDYHQANPSPVAAQALHRIAELYAIERQAQQMDSASRAQLRQEQAQPRLEAMHEWLIGIRQQTADNSGLAKAIDYSLKRWSALARYAQSGELPIDNNAVENSIRPIAIGKKNWLFAGSERAGKRAAAIQSLLGTAKLNGIEPYAWLKDTLEKLPTWPYSRMNDLLPLRMDNLD